MNDRDRRIIYSERDRKKCVKNVKTRVHVSNLNHIHVRTFILSENFRIKN